jgi:ribosomal protein L35
MAKQKTNKTAKKRIKVSNPKGNRKPKLMYKQSHQNHLRTKRSSRSKRRQNSHKVVSDTNEKTLYKKIVNL